MKFFLSILNLIGKFIISANNRHYIIKVCHEDDISFLNYMSSVSASEIKIIKKIKISDESRDDHFISFIMKVQMERQQAKIFYCD